MQRRPESLAGRRLSSGISRESVQIAGDALSKIVQPFFCDCGKEDRLGPLGQLAGGVFFTGAALKGELKLAARANWKTDSSPFQTAD